MCVYRGFKWFFFEPKEEFMRPARSTGQNSSCQPCSSVFLSLHVAILQMTLAKNSNEHPRPLSSLKKKPRVAPLLRKELQ